MAEDRGTDRPRNEADRVNAERAQRARQRVLVGEVEPGEHHRRNEAVEEEVVPFDRGADGACDDRPPELFCMFVFGNRGGANQGTCHVRYPPWAGPTHPEITRGCVSGCPPPADPRRPPDACCPGKEP